jgi:hypothetical protein
MVDQKYWAWRDKTIGGHLSNALSRNLSTRALKAHTEDQ